MGEKNKKTYLAALLLTFPSVTFAASTSIKPFVGIEEIYSDNVNLDSFNEQDTFLTRTNIGLDGKYSSAIVQGQFNSTYSHILYNSYSEKDDGYSTLDTSLNISPWKNGPSLVLEAAIDNVPRSNADDFESDIITGNTTQRERYNARLNHLVSNSNMQLSSYIEYNDTNSDDEIGESHGTRASLTFANGSGHRTLFWNVNGAYSDRKNQGQSARKYQIEAMLGLITGWKLNPFIRYYDERYTGSVVNNFENSQIDSGSSAGVGFRWEPLPLTILNVSYNFAEDSEQNDDYVAADFSWQPTNRTKLSALFNQRFYGDSYGLNIQHKNKRLTNTISYNETVQAFQRERFETYVESTVFCPFNQQINLDDCIDDLTGADNPDLYFELPLLGIRPIEDDQFSIYKQLSWNSQLEYSRTKFQLNVSGNKREDLSTGSTQDYISVNFETTRELSPRSQLKLGFRFTRNDYYTTNVDIETDSVDYYRNYDISYQKKLAKMLSLSFNLRHLMRTSSFNSRDYDETRATISIKKDF